jgi:hypothetical protein
MGQTLSGVGGALNTLGGALPQGLFGGGTSALPGLVTQTGGGGGGSSGGGGSTGGTTGGTTGGGGIGTPGGGFEGSGFGGIPSFTGSVIPGTPGPPGVDEPSTLAALGGAGTAGSNFNVGQSFVDPAQQGFLDQLREQAAGLAGSQQGQIGEFAFPFAEELLGGGRDLLASLSEGSFADPLRDFTLDDSLIEGQISALGTDINEQLQRFLGGAGGLGSNFALGGTLGGGRQQVQEGIATGEAARAFATESAGLRGADVAQRQRLGLDQATSLSNLLGQGQIAGLDNLQGLFNLGISPFGAEFGPLEALAGIIGDPTVLREEFGQGTTAAGGQNPLDIGGTASLIEVLNEIGIFS